MTRLEQTSSGRVEPLAPSKVDVNVSGDLTGTAELRQNVMIEVQPSTYFMGLIKRAEANSTLTLSGKAGESMGGANAPRKPAYAGPAGIGHA